jgi:TonB family protein
LRFVLEEISKLTEINFVFQDHLIEKDSITCRLENMSKEEAIKKILAGRNLSYKIFSDNSVVLFKKEKTRPNEQRPIVVQERIADTLTDKILIKPILITNIPPVYPQTAVWSDIKGNVTVNLLVDKRGNVENVIIENSSESKILDSAAIDYSKSLKFIPANSNGNPQSYWVKMTYRYFFNSDQASNQ